MFIILRPQDLEIEDIKWSGPMLGASHVSHVRVVKQKTKQTSFLIQVFIQLNLKLNFPPKLKKNQKELCCSP